MYWTGRQWVALIWMLTVLVGAFCLLLYRPAILEDFWYTLVPPFVSASLLGIWLIAGVGPVWLRMMGMLVGQSVLILIMSFVWHEGPVGFAPGLAATTAVTAVSMLGLGCLGSLLPIQSSWNVRIALWEVVVSIGLIGVTLAILRIVSELYTWDWQNWLKYTGVHYLVFAIYSGVLMSLVLLPLLVRKRRPRWLAVLLLLIAVAVIPPLDYGTFDLLRLRVKNLNLFYLAHIGQTVMALALLIPMLVGFPGVLVRQSSGEREPTGKPNPNQDPLPSEEDFADMQ